MKPLALIVSLFAFLFFVPLYAQEPLTNETVLKLVKAGLGEDVIVGMVNQQPGKYSVSADDLIELKKAGVSNKIIGAMVNKTSGGATAPAAASIPAAAAGPVTEIGVYYKKGDTWAELLPEVVNWKTGGVLKTVASAGIVKGDVNGHINGPHSRNQLKTPVELLIYVPEGVAITEYQLLRLRDQKNTREFRTVTGGVLHVSGGATRDLLPFEGKKVANRQFSVILPSLGPGEYGFLPPGAVASGHASATLGKMYTFRIVE